MGGETKIFKKEGGKLGQGVGALKKGGLEPPYELWVTILWVEKLGDNLILFISTG